MVSFLITGFNGVKKMKKLLSVLLFLGLVISLPAQTFEGKGADSAEEAVLNYIAALQSCDYNKMISCYAVESLVKNYDVEKYIDHLNCATPTMDMIYPENGLLEQTGKYEALTAISKMIKYQIWTLCDNDFFLNSRIVMRNEDSKATAKKVFPDDAEKRLSSIKFHNFISTTELLKYYARTEDEEDISAYIESIKNYNEKYKKIYGCKEIQDVPVTFFIEGQKYYFFPETLKYGNKWYISPKQGILASILGLQISAGCASDKYHLGLDIPDQEVLPKDSYVITREGKKVTAVMADKEVTDFSKIDLTDPTEVLAAFFVNYFKQNEDWQKFVSPIIHEGRINALEADWEALYGMVDFISITISPDNFASSTEYFRIKISASYQDESFDGEDEVEMFQDPRTRQWYINELPL